MTCLLKWFLAPALLAAGMTLSGADRVEAARARVHVYSPGYHATYVHRYRPVPYYAPRYYVARPVVRVPVYRPAPVVVYPRYRYVPAPVVVPYSAPVYRVWEY